MPEKLKTPPLIEALLEIRWQLKKTGPDTFQDSGYRLATGRLYDRIQERFGFINQLALDEFPDEVTPYQPKIQFRARQNSWPLVQLGPGLATVNFTTPYTWDDFKEAIKFVLPKLIEAYQGIEPVQGNEGLNVTSARLRYINGVKLDWAEDDVTDFLKQKLHTVFELPEEITQSDNIDSPPQFLNLHLGYTLESPPGRGLVRFATGRKSQEPALIWEIVVHSQDDDAPKLTDIEDFWRWLEAAHTVIENWFLELIKGDLKQQFGGN